ncbi:hypothetical protein DL98DRAFT_590664 [Cadophora sp. DSE1049]|nr:hypothetical protein DL98DRAFT_590664 [Cadophora sp. DSE1049]
MDIDNHGCISGRDEASTSRQRNIHTSIVIFVNGDIEQLHCHPKFHIVLTAVDPGTTNTPEVLASSAGFNLFSRLPLEIQYMIWDLAFPLKKRTIYLWVWPGRRHTYDIDAKPERTYTFNEAMNDPRVALQRLSRSPSVPLHACQSSRIWALKNHYISIPCQIDGTSPGAIYVNWKLDGVIRRCSRPTYFKEKTNDTGMRDIPFSTQISAVEEMLLNLSIAETLNPINRAALARFKNLKNLRMVFGENGDRRDFKSQRVLEQALVQAWCDKGVEIPEILFLTLHGFGIVVEGPTLHKFILLNQLQAWPLLNS